MRPSSRHLSDLLRETAGVAPDRVAVIAGEVQLTYGALEHQVDRAASALASQGIRRGGTVGLLCTNRVEWLVTALATVRLGARLAAFNTFARAWDLGYMLRHSDAEVLVVLSRYRSRDYMETLLEMIPSIESPGWSASAFPALREVLVIGDSPIPGGARRLDDVILEATEETPDQHTSAADEALLLYTSGSSSRPKAVPLRHYGIIENGFSIGRRMQLDQEDRVFVPVPLFWAYGAVNALPATLTHRATLVLQEVFEPGEGLDLIERHACTAIYTLPNITNALLEHRTFDGRRTRSLRTGVTIGSESDLRRAALELGVEQICNIYGGTETYGNCCVTPASWPLAERLVSQGPALPGFELRIVSEQAGEDVMADEVGEILVRGYVADGYLGSEPGAEMTFTEDGWYRTGDLGRLAGDGHLQFESRASEMIKTGGINVSPREVEEYIELHPAVAQAAVVGVPDPIAGEVPVAFVVAAGAVDSQQLRDHCDSGIARYKIPARFHLVDSLPKTDTGKLARRTLADLDSSFSVAPR